MLTEKVLKNNYNTLLNRLPNIILST